MKVEQWQLAQLRPYEHNPRLNDEAVDVVAASIQEFGFRQPIVVDEDGVSLCLPLGIHRGVSRPGSDAGAGG